MPFLGGTSLGMTHVHVKAAHAKGSRDRNLRYTPLPAQWDAERHGLGKVHATFFRVAHVNLFLA